MGRRGLFWDRVYGLVVWLKRLQGRQILEGMCRGYSKHADSPFVLPQFIVFFGIAHVNGNHCVRENSAP